MDHTIFRETVSKHVKGMDSIQLLTLKTSYIIKVNILDKNDKKYTLEGDDITLLEDEMFLKGLIKKIKQVEVFVNMQLIEREAILEFVKLISKYKVDI